MKETGEVWRIGALCGAARASQVPASPPPPLSDLTLDRRKASEMRRREARADLPGQSAATTCSVVCFTTKNYQSREKNLPVFEGNASPAANGTIWSRNKSVRRGSAHRPKPTLESHGQGHIARNGSLREPTEPTEHSVRLLFGGPVHYSEGCGAVLLMPCHVSQSPASPFIYF